jgi:hypothetical protein
MNFYSLFGAVLSRRELHTATESSLAAKLLTPLGIDVTNLTFESILSRGADLALAYVNIANALALIGAVFYVTTLLMRTIVPLRIFGIVGDVFFIGYAVLAQSVTTFFLYLWDCPRVMLKLTKRSLPIESLRSLCGLDKTIM